MSGVSSLLLDATSVYRASIQLDLVGKDNCNARDHYY